MRTIEIEVTELVGYALGETDGNRIRKLGTAKLGEKGRVTNAEQSDPDARSALSLKR